MSSLIALTQIRDGVVRPTLKELGAWSPAAERLVLGTGLHETQFRYRYQWRGPARGFYQFEETPYEDVLSYIKRKPKFFKAVSSFSVQPFSFEQLVWNFKYATAFCRLFYYRFPEPLPEWDDHEGLGWYWKEKFNTHLGAGTVEQFVKHAEIMRRLPL